MMNSSGTVQPMTLWIADLSIAWETIDLETWTVTFSGLTKPLYYVCSRRYQHDECLRQDLGKKPRRLATVCFDFNKTSGYQRPPPLSLRACLPPLWLQQSYPVYLLKTVQ